MKDNLLLIELMLTRRNTQLDDNSFYLQVAEDNGYRYSKDGLREIRYLNCERMKIRKSINRLETYWTKAVRKMREESKK